MKREILQLCARCSLGRFSTIKRNFRNPLPNRRAGFASKERDYSPVFALLPR